MSARRAIKTKGLSDAKIISRSTGPAADRIFEQEYLHDIHNSQMGAADIARLTLNAIDPNVHD
jgi:hypothetical protein